MPHKFFTFLGSDDHYDADGDVDGFHESYCCQVSDDYCVEWNEDNPTEGFAVYRSGRCVECSNLLTVATAIINHETLDVDTFAENGVEQCENCGGYWIKGDIPTRHSLGCRHETREEHAIRMSDVWYESQEGLAAIREVNEQWGAGK